MPYSPLKIKLKIKKLKKIKNLKKKRQVARASPMAGLALGVVRPPAQGQKE
jgi:hypothetical protein